MAGGLHLEQYFDSLESLPSELQRNFHHMRDLDQQTQDLMRNIDKCSDDYLKEVRTLSPDRRSEQVNKILKMFNTAKEYSDNKVHLAVQTYELVDKHIRRLDSDLAKFEAEVKDKPLLVTKKDDESTTKKKGRKKKEDPGNKTAPIKKKKQQRGGATAAAGAASDEEEPPPKAGVGRKKKKRNKEDAPAVGVVGGIASMLPGLSSMVHPSEAMDMPVDPNEPTYCLCHQVSYGEMIACDKTDCPIEWFHFACVNLTTKPKGKWYCPRCITDVKKKK